MDSCLILTDEFNEDEYITGILTHSSCKARWLNFEPESNANILSSYDVTTASKRKNKSAFCRSWLNVLSTSIWDSDQANWETCHLGSRSIILLRAWMYVRGFLCFVVLCVTVNRRLTMDRYHGQFYRMLNFLCHSLFCIRRTEGSNSWQSAN
jgi:hypothetical protein